MTPNEPKPTILSAALAATQDAAMSLKSLAGSPALAVGNLVALAVTALLLCCADRSSATGILILLWGAGASLLAYRAGQEKRLDAKLIVAAYLLASGVLYLLLNGVYRLLGV